MDLRIALLLEALDRAYDTKSWHGPVLKGALRGVTLREAVFRPAPKRNSIHALIQHAAYWKFIVRRIVTGAYAEKFPRSPCNWPDPKNPVTAQQLKADLKLLDDEHANLRAAVAAFSPKRLNAKTPKGAWTYGEMILGVAAHDLYHAGQVSLLKRMARGKG
ncbi:MAG: DinB family protein [Planctomycetota bacterium]|nr:DinB family protein [Planctomycetota bacterium]